MSSTNVSPALIGLGLQPMPSASVTALPGSRAIVSQGANGRFERGFLLGFEHSRNGLDRTYFKGRDARLEFSRWCWPEAIAETAVATPTPVALLMARK